MMFPAMLTAAFQGGDNGIPIRYRFNGKLFNLRRLQAKSKVQTEVLDEFLFADDMAKGAPTEEKMQKGVDQVSDSCDNYYLTISIKKTEVVYQPAAGKKKVREKSRECHNHKPQPFPDPKRKRKPTNPNKHKSNKRTKSTKISSLFLSLTTALERSVE